MAQKTFPETYDAVYTCITQTLQEESGEHEFLIFMLDLCTQLLQNIPRLQNPVRRPGEDIIRLTGRNH